MFHATSHSKSRSSRNVCFSSFDEFHERRFYLETACMEKKATRLAAKVDRKVRTTELLKLHRVFVCEPC